MLCDHLEGWDREGRREAQEGRDMGIYVYIWLIHFVVHRRNTVKQLYSNKDVKKTKQKTKPQGKKEKEEWRRTIKND